MKSQVYVCGTLYHIFISTLKNINENDRGNKSLLVVTDFTQDLESLANNLVAEGFFTNYVYAPFFEIQKLYHKETGIYKRHIRRNKYLIQYLEQYSGIKEHYDFISKSEINLFSNLGPSSVYFLIRYKNNIFRQLEDGYRNYHPIVSNFKAFKRKYILNTPQGEGRDFQIKTIEVQHPEKLPAIVRHKGVKLDIQELINSLSNEKRQKLIDVFAHGQSFSVTGHKRFLLITQPLSEDKIISEHKKIELYKNLIEEEGEGYKIYIKPHPRELTNYKKKLSIEFTEIPRNFPLELFELIEGIAFEKGITIFSSAIDNLKCLKEKKIMGKDYLNKI